MKRNYIQIGVGVLFAVFVLCVPSITPVDAQYYTNNQPYYSNGGYYDYNNNYNGYNQNLWNYPNNNYGYNYWNYQHYPYYNTLSVWCSATVDSRYSNGSNYVIWNAYASGGNGSYTYSWTGTDNLWSGSTNSNSLSFTYTLPGAKVASVTVWSGNQSITKDCGSIYVNSYLNNYYPPIPFPPIYPPYNPYVPYNPIPYVQTPTYYYWQ